MKCDLESSIDNVKKLQAENWELRVDIDADSRELGKVRKAFQTAQREAFSAKAAFRNAQARAFSGEESFTQAQTDAFRAEEKLRKSEEARKQAEARASLAEETLSKAKSAPFSSVASIFAPQTTEKAHEALRTFDSRRDSIDGPPPGMDSTLFPGVHVPWVSASTPAVDEMSSLLIELGITDLTCPGF